MRLEPIEDRPPNITYMSHGVLPDRWDFTKFTNEEGQVFMKKTKPQPRKDRAGQKYQEVWYELFDVEEGEE